MITDEESSNLFSNIDVIFGINTKLLTDLKSVLASWNAQTGKIAPVFIEFGNYFKMYWEYCNNTDNSQKTMNDLFASS